MYKNRAAAPIVATVIEKMLSTALYWNTDRSGIADPSKQKPSIIASPVLSVVLKKCRRLTFSATILSPNGKPYPAGHWTDDSPREALSDAPETCHIVASERFFGKRRGADERDLPSVDGSPAAHAEEELRAACTHSRACLERSEGLYPSLNPEKYVAFSTLSV
jgi:hypothetical protein